MSVHAALCELEREAGGQFDPRLVSAFISFIRSELLLHEDFDAFLAEGADELEYLRARTRMEALMRVTERAETHK
jgi:hypothetical protein